MKKLLTCILLLANFWSGLAFAWDTHPEVTPDHGAVTINLMADAANDTDHQDGKLFHNDHCSHGAAHLIGILNDMATPLVISGHAHHSFSALALPSLYIAPLLRPPIV